MSIVVLAGGVGGARFVGALAEAVDPRELTVVGNVGDDLEIFGLHVSPDLDTLLYSLAGVGDDERGWGRRDESWHALETAAELGADPWFKLGDRDLGLHLVRTSSGQPLSGITRKFTESLGVEVTLLPSTDDRLRTWVETPAGALEFQDWFVRRSHRDRVDAVRFEGEDTAWPAPGVCEAIGSANLLAIAPSNPFVSIAPILAVREIRAAFENRRVPAVAVSPLIGGRAVKGPADAMFTSLAAGTEPADVARCYEGLIDALVIDEADAGGAPAVEELGIRTVVTRTLMPAANAELAEAVLGAVVTPTS